MRDDGVARRPLDRRQAAEQLQCRCRRSAVTGMFCSPLIVPMSRCGVWIETG